MNNMPKSMRKTHGIEDMKAKLHGVLYSEIMVMFINLYMHSWPKRMAIRVKFILSSLENFQFNHSDIL